MNELFSFSYLKFSPLKQIGMHQQPTWELSYVIHGSGHRTIGTLTEPFCEGEVVLVIPDIPHQWKFSETDDYMECISIFFSPNLLDIIGSIPQMHEMTAFFGSQEEAVSFSGELRQRIAEQLQRMKSETEAERIATLLGLLVAISQSRGEMDIVGRRALTDCEQRMYDVEQFLKCNLKRDLSVADIARHVSMHPSSLCSFFRRQTGMTLFARLTEIRLQSACYLLRSTHLTVQQVCYESGFNDVPHFCRIFKQTFGNTPKGYREKERMEE